MIDDLLEIKKQLIEFDNFLSDINSNYSVLKKHFSISEYDNSYVYKEISNLIFNLKEINSNVSYLKNKLSLLNFELDQKILSRNHQINKILPKAFLSIDQSVESDIGDFFTKFTSHQYPTMQLGVNDGFLTDFLVGAEPLYLVDIDESSIAKAVNKYNSVFQQRLCTYKLQIDENSFFNFNKLKFENNTFGFILCWEIIPYCDFNLALDLINYIYNLLKPGATAIFNFNNPKKIKALQNVEQNIVHYQSLELIVNHLKSLKISDYKHIDFNDSIDWIEITKPGKLTTVKLQSVIGEIYPKSY